MNKRKLCSILPVLFIILILGASDSWAISWRKDLGAALKEAKKSEKPLMLDFYTKWCHWCREMDYNTYTDPKINELSSDFICVKVDAEKSPWTTYKYSVRGYPTVIFLNSDGSINNRTIGYKSPEALKAAMYLALKDVKGSRYGKALPGKARKTTVKKLTAMMTGSSKFDKEEFERKRKKNIEKTRNRNLELNGIIIDKEKTPVAIINDVFVKKGETIGEGKVLKITKDEVKVAFKDNKIVTLTID